MENTKTTRRWGGSEADKVNISTSIDGITYVQPGTPCTVVHSQAQHHLVRL